MRKLPRLTLNKRLKEKVSESLAAVLPITAIVLLLSITIIPLDSGFVMLFLFGALLLILGMGLFTLGVDMSMMPMGDGFGVSLGNMKHKWLAYLISFLLGVVVTIAEPDLQVLADKFPALDKWIIIIPVAVGVGLFLVFALLRMALKIPLSYVLLFFYTVVFVLAFFVDPSFVPVSFDSGGVTTGPITVPFIMALGVGLAAVRSDKRSRDDSFGLVAMCSIGPILSMLIIGIVFKDLNYTEIPAEPIIIESTRDAAMHVISGLPHYFAEVGIAIAPILALCFVYELITRRFKKHQLIKIISGFVYTYLGLVLFLTGVNTGFMPVGEMIGKQLALSGDGLKWLLIPIGMLVGYFIVSAEPAVHVLKKQVEEVSNGAISQKALAVSLSLGIAASVGIAMLRILTGISLLWFLIPGYIISLIMTFFVPQMFTGIAFDAGGVASGPMTATFLLPLAMGACTALGGNVLTDAFGIVAMVAMTPLLTIQLLGLYSKVKRRIDIKSFETKMNKADDTVLYFD